MDKNYYPARQASKGKGRVGKGLFPFCAFLPLLSPPLPSPFCAHHTRLSVLSVSLVLLTSALMILIAVGAVNMLTTLCCSITRKNAPASGVPIGLPLKWIYKRTWADK